MEIPLGHGACIHKVKLITLADNRLSRLLDGFVENTYLQFLAYLVVYVTFIWELVKEPLWEHFQKPNFFSTEFSPISSR